MQRGEQQAVSREARVGTNPRGREPAMGGRQVEDLSSTGFSNRNQFDRASQLRRSKKRKKSKDSASTLPRSPSKEANSAKTATEIVRQETTMGRREPGMRKALFITLRVAEARVGISLLTILVRV